MDVPKIKQKQKQNKRNLQLVIENKINNLTIIIVVFFKFVGDKIYSGRDCNTILNIFFFVNVSWCFII